MKPRRKPDIGRPRPIDGRGERRFHRLFRAEKHATVTGITHDFNSADVQDISRHTIHRSIWEFDVID